jgi:hypothetical protein
MAHPLLRVGGEMQTADLEVALDDGIEPGNYAPVIKPR